MPDAPSKRKWDKENVVLISIKLMRKTDSDIIEYLNGKNKHNTICEAIRFYIEHHKEDKEC